MDSDVTELISRVELQGRALIPDDTDRSAWLREASRQIEFSVEALEAIDRSLGLSKGDVLVCETTCLGYALHALTVERGIEELWLVPAFPDFMELSDELLDSLDSRLRVDYGEQLGLLDATGDTFKGLTDFVPNDAFKLLITDEFDGLHPQDELEWQIDNSFWRSMLGIDGAVGAVTNPFPIDSEQDDGSGTSEITLPQLAHHAMGAYYSAGFVRVTELPGGYFVLATGKRDGTILLEDISRSADSQLDRPWICEVPAITPAVNKGCLIPSSIRSGVKVLEETTLAELATRISRGTTLSEKDLYVIKNGLSFFAKEIESGFCGPSFHRVFESPGKYYYYIDSSCLQEGSIRPKVLEVIPKGQERYIVDSSDGEVLLVSRSSKEPVVYEASCPTLISNSMFVVRLVPGASAEYLACWMRGSFARAWMDNDGKILTKAVLANLPVPILDEDVMEGTVYMERELDMEIMVHSRMLRELRRRDRFDPAGAKHRALMNKRYKDYSESFEWFDSNLPEGLSVSTPKTGGAG